MLVPQGARFLVRPRGRVSGAPDAGGTAVDGFLRVFSGRQRWFGGPESVVRQVILVQVERGARSVALAHPVGFQHVFQVGRGSFLGSAGVFGGATTGSSGQRASVRIVQDGRGIGLLVAKTRPESAAVAVAAAKVSQRVIRVAVLVVGEAASLGSVVVETRVETLAKDAFADRLFFVSLGLLSRSLFGRVEAVRGQGAVGGLLFARPLAIRSAIQARVPVHSSRRLRFFPDNFLDDKVLAILGPVELAIVVLEDSVDADVSLR